MTSADRWATRRIRLIQALNERGIRLLHLADIAVIYLTLGELVSAGWLSVDRKPVDLASSEQPSPYWRLAEAGDTRIKQKRGAAEHTPTGTSNGY